MKIRMLLAVLVLVFAITEIYQAVGCAQQSKWFQMVPHSLFALIFVWFAGLFVGLAVRYYKQMKELKTNTIDPTTPP